jgi:hypothetical protein
MENIEAVLDELNSENLVNYSQNVTRYVPSVRSYNRVIP